jgi:FkbM family methyltransferase
MAKAGFDTIYAFEPIPETYERLVANLRRNPELAAKVVPTEKGLGAAKDRLYFQVISSSPGQSKIAASVGGTKASDTRQCDVITLDSYFPLPSLLPPLFLKIDVEGFEVDALKGAQRLLESGRIRFIYTEVIPQALKEAGSSVTELWNLLNSVGFEPVVIKAKKFVTAPFAEALRKAGERRNVLFRARA